MLKKILLIVSGLILIVGLIVGLIVVRQQQELRQKAAPATTMSLSPSQITKNVGDEFSIDAVVDTGANSIQLVQIELSFDPTKVKPLSFTNSATFPNIISSETFTTDGKAQISVGTASIAQPFTGQATAATIRFQALQATDAPITLSYTAQTFVGSIAEGRVNSLVGTTPANITISGSGTVATPTPTQATGTVDPTPTTSTITPTAGPSPTPGPTNTPAPTSVTTPLPTATTTPTTGPSPTPGALSLVISGPTDGLTTSDTTPTFSGTAKAGSSITIAVYPGGTTGVVTVDSSGNWSFTPQTALGQGVYTLSITASDPITGASENSSTSFTISSGTATLTATPTPTTATSSQTTPTTTTAPVPVTGTEDVTLIVAALGILLLIGGAALPFILQ